MLGVDIVDDVICCATLVGRYLFHDMRMIQDATLVLLRQWVCSLRYFRL
jgi:hypothetical protein